MNPTDLILLTDAGRLFPAHQGRHPHRNTLVRWGVNGVKGVKLRTQRVGGRRYTCEQWVREFVAALNYEPAPATERPAADQRARELGV